MFGGNNMFAQGLTCRSCEQAACVTDLRPRARACGARPSNGAGMRSWARLHALSCRPLQGLGILRLKLRPPSTPLDDRLLPWPPTRKMWCFEGPNPPGPPHNQFRHHMQVPSRPRIYIGARFLAIDSFRVNLGPGGCVHLAELHMLPVADVGHN